MSGASGGAGTVVALDLDGTLVDCRARQVELATALVPGLPAEAFWSAKREGATTRAALEQVGLEPARAADVAARWTAAIEDDRWLACDRALPRADAALTHLRGRGFRLVVLTARRRPDAVRTQLVRLGIASQLDAVQVVDPCDPAPAKAAVLRELAVAAFVGDTETDARAATLAAVPFRAVASGQRSARRLGDAGLAPIHDDVYAAALAI